MATRFRNKISLLVLASAPIIVLAGEWTIFRSIERQHGRAVTTVIAGLLRDESTMSRSYLLAQSLEDMQTFGVINCARVAQIDGSIISVFYDSTFKASCNATNLMAVVLPGIDGYQWEVKVQPVLSLSFYTMKWLTMALSMLVLIGAFWIVRYLFAEEKRRRKVAEIQNGLLEELARQVRHDVASPITALRFVAEKAPLDSDTKEFLNLAVQRTQGIFETLKQVKNRTEYLPLRDEIENIVYEKWRTDSTFPRIEYSMGGETLVLQRLNLVERFQT